MRARKRLGLKRKALRSFAEQAVTRGESVPVLGNDIYIIPRVMFKFRQALLIFASYPNKLVLLTIVKDRAFGNVKTNKKIRKYMPIR